MTRKLAVEFLSSEIEDFSQVDKAHYMILKEEY